MISRALRAWPLVEERFRAGRISARHAAVVCSALTRLPDVDDAWLEPELSELFRDVLGDRGRRGGADGRRTRPATGGA